MCDEKLISILSPLDGEVWHNLAFTVIASFLDNVAWKGASFMLDLDAHENNAHVIAVAMHELFKAFISKRG